ncbi:hypothetical protein Athai_21940 [Actinocatenispora thailandica]|uniref:Peptidase A4 family protein n=1 Tax=Actinocatenispora thailandica TaxID=227318 RepID=A0A7R7DN93_9ACTN|nr:G1 family glutamic endopeptidase [Actinocatenispora thailandica]BCJ34691.1 hypothetical protein Athai_21940 [Actinocatenispora thailandica]
MPNRILLRLAGVGMAAAMTIAALVTGPAAAVAGPAGYGPATPHLTDNVWGGYVAQGSGFDSISGSWVEPDASCTSTQDLYAPWVGIDGYGSQTVEQTGVETSCQNGYPAYRAWYEMYPAAPVYWNDPVGPGDTITGSVTATGGGGYQITLTDRTAGWTERTTQYLGAQDVSAEAVIESPTGSYPSFAELDFSGITVDGQVFDAYQPTGLDSGGYSPGPLSNGAFSMTPGGWSWPSSAHHHVAGPVRY